MIVGILRGLLVTVEPNSFRRFQISFTSLVFFYPRAANRGCLTIFVRHFAGNFR